MLWYLYRLRGSGRVTAGLPIDVDSPMSTNATDLYQRNTRLLRHGYSELQGAFQMPRYVRVMENLPRTPTQKVEKHVLRSAGVTADTWDREKAGIRVAREKIRG